MAKDFSKKLYNSKVWQHTRNAYKKSVGGLCERCKKDGLIKAGEIVHHKEHLTPENINDPTFTLDWNNLELLCRDCHTLEHENEQSAAVIAYIKKKKKKEHQRFYIDEDGNLKI